MSIQVLAFAICIPIPFCIFRMKRYGLDWVRLLVIYVIVSTVGAVGACVGAWASGEPIFSIRLYGLMLFDFLLLWPLSRLMKMTVWDLGDFISVPIMMVCSAAKISCWVRDCCRGIYISWLGTNTSVQFPSQIFEMVLWAAMAVLLIFKEKRNRFTGQLWPFAMIWFGVLRFVVDFLRLSKEPTQIYYMFMSGAKFWSLMTVLVGCGFMYVTLRRKLTRKPTIFELLKSCAGIPC